MSEYRDYTITITLKSPIATPLQSDTIFGHICWAVRFLKWDEEDRLSKFLSLYEEDSQPPLLLSNGFPKGYLPKPVIPPVTQEVLEKILDERYEKENRIENSFRIKTIKKTDIIPKEKFKELQQDMITPEKLFRALDNCYDETMEFKKKQQSMMVQHNTIDRIKGSVREGGLFSQEATFFDNGFGVFEIYLKTICFSFEDLEKIFKYISDGGFGRDKSTGKGYFTFEIREGIDLPGAAEPNAFMTLSSYIPKKDDPTEGYYNIIHKYGKLGGLYAKGVSKVNGNPFKVPLIMFSSGSVFSDKNYEQNKVYGSLLKNVHKNEDIRHYAYAFPVGINVEDRYEEL